ncbi:alpha/beta hydrolase [Chitinophaga sedimenti]|uniref:alpha/beta fold hydrolase n=1 Tax=Chitinophaga sedimenti TaxID=2033606 RepID=UPI002006A089|nr:alpha/beta hydrolase [Chitinophaga sedimenti]MCK7555532.1 alpha/beta hydrolase [Chitinophaga sedimenti]
MGIRHPQLVNKLVIASANYRRDGMPPGFFDGMVHATLDMMPKPLQGAFLAINPDKKALQTMFERDKARMIGFKDIPDEAIKGIAAPTLVMTGDQDVVSPEHAVRLFRTLPKAQMAILPAGHGDYLGEIMAERKDSPVPSLVAALIKDFLR